MNRNSFIVRFARGLQKFPFEIFRIFETPLLRSVRRSHAQKENMIILLAAPRSGSTLTYQLLCSGLDSYYLSNLSHLIHKLPILGGYLSGLICKSYVSDFKSSKGFVAGMSGPAEGLHFWRYWYGCGLNERDNLVQNPTIKERRKYLRDSIRRLGKKQRPFLTGYLGHVLCIEELQRDFPNAIFVRLHRDPVDNVLSIIHCAKEESQDWFSVRPIECKDDNLDPKHKAAAQVYWLRRKMSLVDENRTITIRYEDLCASPVNTLQKVIEFANSKGMELVQRAITVESFDTKKHFKDDEWKEVLEIYEQFEVEHGKLPHWESEK